VSSSPPLPLGAVGDPPCGVRPEIVFGLQPSAARSQVLGTFFLDEGNPLVQRLASLWLQLGNPFLNHCDAGMNVVVGRRLRGGFRHKIFDSSSSLDRAAKYHE